MKASGKHQTLKGRLARYLLPHLGTLIILLLFVLAQNAGAAPWRAPAAAPGSTTTVSYQGRLFDSSGNPVNGNVTLTFSLYDQASSGTRKWGPETHAGVSVSDGLFSVLLGSRTADGIPQSALGGDLWLETAVNGETLSPREQLGAVPYAMRAGDASTGVPVGTVVSWWRPSASVPVPSDKWAIADGSVVADSESPLYGQPLPNLTNRFIMGVAPGSIGTTGGSNTLNLTHLHAIPNHFHSVSGSTGQVSGEWNGGYYDPAHETRMAINTYVKTWYVEHSHSFSLNTGGWSGNTENTSLQVDNQPEYVGLLYLVRVK